MRTAHTVAAVRAAEQALMAKLPDGTLMQRAAAALAAVCASLLGEVYGARVVVLAGSGDNGGDALYAAARLAGRSAEVTAIAAGAKLHDAAAAELVARGGRITPATDDRAASDHKAEARDQVAAAARRAISSADLILDGLTGIGGHGGLREPAAALATLAAGARDEGALVVAVDLPSGIDADTGEVSGTAVQADVTVTFGTLKPGLLIDPGASLAGPAELIGIGLDPFLVEPAAISLQAADVAAILPRPAPESDKYRRGVLGLVAGSDQYTGAAVLSCGGAIHGGAGMVRFVSAAVAVDVVRQRWPEAVLTTYDPDRPAQAIETAGRVQAWTVGPGIGTGPQAEALLTAVLASDVPVLVDADGLTVLAAHRDLLGRAAPVLITPHAGELARLLSADRGEIEARRLHYARAAAAELGVTVLLKGSTTVIAEPDGRRPVLVNSTGTAWLATAGSGDVLSGLAGSLLAQGIDAPQAAAAAAYLHGMAGRLAARDAPIGASDLLGTIPAAIRAVTSDSV
jgi:ADP-dependent NAD(P)H-hydrate dehydratase / NAD(P)H-hydrate epimerase